MDTKLFSLVKSLNTEIFTNPIKIARAVSDFIEFIKEQPLSINDEVNFNEGYLYQQESYKRRYQEEVKKILSWDKWEYPTVNKHGQISEKYLIALNHKIDGEQINLIYKIQLGRFKALLADINTENQLIVERTLFSVYRSSEADEREAYNNAANTFGRNHDVLSFLFFIKDPTRYLPLRSDLFEMCFNYLSIKHKMAGRGKVTWEVYTKFVNIVRTLQQQVLAKYLHCDVSLIDAHSFLWIVFPHDKQKDWNKFTIWRYKRDALELLYDNELNEEVDQSISEEEEQSTGDMPMQKPTKTITQFGRAYKPNKKFSNQALKNANYSCEIDPEHPTFIRKYRNINYTEPHHLIPVKYQDDYDTSIDIPANIVSLCSNCHNWLHYGAGTSEALRKLFDERVNRLKQAEISITFEELQNYYKEET